MSELPRDEAAERIVMGYLLAAREPMFQLYETPLTGTDFSLPAHEAIFEIVSSQFAAGARRADLTALAAKLKKHQSLGADPRAVIKALVGHHYGLEQTREAVKRLKAVTTRRTVITTLREQLARCLDPATDIAEIITDTMRPLSDATTSKADRQVVDQHQAHYEAYEEIMKAVEHSGECMGIPTPFRKLNWLTSGFFRGDYGILAGRPGTGKTAMALNLATHAAQSGSQVLFFSLEMPRQQLLKRMVASKLRIDARKFRGIGKITEDEIERLHGAEMEKLSRLPIRHYDFAAVKPYQFRAICHAECARHRTALVIVDYIGLMRPEKKSGQRYLDVGEVSEALRCTAKELGVHILALAQMNRQIDTANREPVLSDLRESGNLEQDTDNVWFLYHGEGGEEGDAIKPVILKVAKNRHGPEGKVKLWFEREFLSFKEQAEVHNEG